MKCFAGMMHLEYCFCKRDVFNIEDDTIYYSSTLSLGGVDLLSLSIAVHTMIIFLSFYVCLSLVIRITYISIFPFLSITYIWIFPLTGYVLFLSLFSHALFLLEFFSSLNQDHSLGISPTWMTHCPIYSVRFSINKRYDSNTFFSSHPSWSN